jgi:hypothetical protein
MTEALLTSSAGQTSTESFALGSAAFFNSGSNQITAIYNGDSHYLPSTSNVASVTATRLVGNFTMTPQASEITVPPGGAASVGNTEAKTAAPILSGSG